MHHMSDLSRRSLVTSAAALPALAVPAVAVAAVNVAMPASTLIEQSAEPDPVFAAIERYQALFDIVEDVRGDQTCELSDEIMDEIYERRCVLAETAPTTLAGIIAIMRYRRELQDFNPHHRPPLAPELRFQLFDMLGGADPRNDITAWLAIIERSLETIASGKVQS
jgi:hypothetical protein